MAKIGIQNISDVKLNAIPVERTVDSEGDLAFAPEIKEMYTKKGYDVAPKSRQEADARGIRDFNGLMSSFTRIFVYRSGGQTIVAADIAPTRYLLGQAMRDYVAAHPDLSAEDVQRTSPDMANVSLVCPVKKEGKYFLLSQIKGKALGSGEIHAGIVAGNVKGKHVLQEGNPLIRSLQDECSEELGMDLSHLDSTSFVYMVDERETGQINFASVVRQADANKIFEAYEANTKRKLPKDQLEVMALAMLPIAGFALIPLEKGVGLEGILCYHPTVEGLKEVRETRRVRPYTQATLDYLRENAGFLLNKAGF